MAPRILWGEPYGGSHFPVLAHPPVASTFVLARIQPPTVLDKSPALPQTFALAARVA